MTDELFHGLNLTSVSCLFLQTACSHAVLSVYPALWPGSVLSAVRLGHGASAWTAHHCGNHEPQTTGTWQSPVPLPKTRSHGKIRGDWVMMKLNVWRWHCVWYLSLNTTLHHRLLAVEPGACPWIWVIQTRYSRAHLPTQHYELRHELRYFRSTSDCARLHAIFLHTAQALEPNSSIETNSVNI